MACRTVVNGGAPSAEEFVSLQVLLTFGRCFMLRVFTAWGSHGPAFIYPSQGLTLQVVGAGTFSTLRTTQNSPAYPSGPVQLVEQKILIFRPRGEARRELQRIVKEKVETC